MSRPDILKQVRTRIEHAAPGDIFIPADFSDLGEARKIAMCLSRLREDGTLRPWPEAKDMESAPTMCKGCSPLAGAKRRRSGNARAVPQSSEWRTYGPAKADPYVRHSENAFNPCFFGILSFRRHAAEKAGSHTEAAATEHL